MLTPQAKPEPKRLEATIKASNGCEWSVFIGLSDYSLDALKSAQLAPENSPEKTKAIRKDRVRIATQDQNWIDNCNNKVGE